MANEEHLALLKKGVKAWNEWRKQHGDVIPDFRGAMLYEADLRGAQLESAVFGWANLSRAS